MSQIHPIEKYVAILCSYKICQQGLSGPHLQVILTLSKPNSFYYNSVFCNIFYINISQ